MLEAAGWKIGTSEDLAELFSQNDQLGFIAT
jgi:hypothetical protein